MLAICSLKLIDLQVQSQFSASEINFSLPLVKSDKARSEKTKILESAIRSVVSKFKNKPIPVKKIVQNPIAKSSKQSDKKIFKDVSNLSFTPKVSVFKDSERPLLEPVQIEKKNKEENIEVRVVKNRKENILSEENESQLTIQSNAYELSMHDMNEQGLTVVRKLPKVSWVDIAIDVGKYEKLIAEKTKTKMNTDRISTEQSALEKSKSVINEISNSKVVAEKKPPRMKQKVVEDELLFFEYSKSSKKDQPEIVETEAEKDHAPSVKPVEVPVRAKAAEIVATKKVEQPKVSSVVTSQNVSALANSLKKLQKTIEPAKKDQVDTRLAVLTKQTQNKKSSDVLPDNMINSAAGFVETPKENNFECLQEAKGRKNNEYSFDYSISLNRIDVGDQSTMRHFRMHFADDQDEMIQDYGSGKIQVGGDVIGNMNTRRATLVSRGNIPTSLDIVFEDSSANLAIPTFSFEKLDSFVTYSGKSSDGAHLLVELDDSTEDVELGVDHKYKAKFYLDKNYKIIDRNESDYYYVFFMGVPEGNTIVNYKNFKNELMTKIIYLSEDEVYYDPNFYAEIKNDSFRLFEEGVMSNCKTMLPVQQSKISTWAFDAKIKKESLNGFSVPHSIYPVGSRKYYELNHLPEPIYFGRWSQGEIIIPSEQYINQVMGQFSTRSGDCMVQLNLNRTPKDITFNGLSSKDSMALEARSLDRDGKFYNGPSDQTRRLFLKGSEQGVINVKLEYLDGSKQFIQTFCSENTYLVEQL